MEAVLDKGEASALVLVQEIENSFLVIDEIKARKTAKKLNINFTGTLGVLLQAKILGHVESLKKIIAELKMVDFRISKAVEEEILEKANEK